MRTVLVMVVGLLLVGCAAAAEEAAPAKTLNPKIVALPDNTWLRMKPPREPDGRNYSGCCIGESKLGPVWYWGGGHFSYDCNDVDFYDLVTNKWTRSYTPERNPWGAKNRWAVSPREGSPTARHTYQQVCWWPERKLFFLHSGANTWEFDPFKMKWTCVAGKHSKSKRLSPGPQGVQNVHCFYSPELKAPVSIVSTGQRGVYVYSADKGWTKSKKGLPQRAVWNEMYSAHVPSLGVQLISQRKTPFMWLYNPKTEEWTPLADVPEQLRGCQALAADPISNLVLAVVPDRKEKARLKHLLVWTMDPKTLKWAEVKPAGPVPRGWGSWAPLWYDPDHNAFFLLNRIHQSKSTTWVYCYKRAADKKGAD